MGQFGRVKRKTCALRASELPRGESGTRTRVRYARPYGNRTHDLLYERKYDVNLRLRSGVCAQRPPASGRTLRVLRSCQAQQPTDRRAARSASCVAAPLATGG
eukprot:scaffold15999_cov73-Phaeocystis_antarctica.AAC.1